MKKFTKLVAMVLTLAMVVSMSMMFVSAADSTGYTFSKGTLTITDKTLVEKDYTSAAPWDSVKAGVTSIVLPDGVTKLGNYVFDGCTSVTSFVIPTSVNTVGSAIFFGNNSITVTYEGTATQWASVTKNPFGNDWISSVTCTGSGQTQTVKLPTTAGSFKIENGIINLDSAFSGTFVSTTFKSALGAEYSEYVIGLYTEETASAPITTSNAGTGQYLCLIDDEGTVCDYAVIVFKGDVNGDGCVDSSDYTASKGTLDQYKKKAADINGDGIVNALDRAAINICLGNWQKDTSSDTYTPSLSAQSSDVTFGESTTVTVKLSPSNSSNGVRAFAFTVTYDQTKFTYESTANSMPESSCFSKVKGNYTITPNAGSITIEYYDDSNTPLATAVDLVNLSFKSKGLGSAVFGITSAGGVDNDGRFMNVSDNANALSVVIAMSGTAPSEPVLKEKTSSTVKLEYSSDYIYGISTDPTGGNTIVWADAPGMGATKLGSTDYTVSADSTSKIITFGNLDEMTQYYLFRKQKTVGLISAALSVSTEMGNPVIKSSSASTIVVDISKYTSGTGTYTMNLSLSATISASDYKKITIKTDGTGSENGYIAVPVGSDGRSVNVLYIIDYANDIITFSGLLGGGTSATITAGTRYYIHVMHVDGDETHTASAVRAISPEITIDQDNTGNTQIAVKYAEIFRYSISSTSTPNNYVKATTSGTTVTEGTNKYTVTHVGLNTVFTGLKANTKYTIFVYVDDNDSVASEVVSIEATTGAAAKAATVMSTTASTITIEYDIKNVYGLDGANWTPSLQTTGTVGAYTYTVKSDTTSSTGLSVTFSGLTANKTYTVYTKVNGSSTAPATVEAKTGCDHKWGEKTDEIAATYTSAGSYKHKCTICGAEETVTVPKLTNCQHLNKTRATEQDTAATCTKEGRAAYKCPDCGEYIYETVPAKGHSSVTNAVTVKVPTCTVAGSRNILCSECHEIIRAEAIPALGHTAGEPVVVPSTCTQFGVTTVSCTRCHEIISTEYETELASHTPGEWTVLQDATDTTDGVRVKRCTQCGTELDRQTISKTLQINPNGSYTYLISSYDPSVNISDAITKAYAFSYYSLKITYSDGTTVELDSAAIEALNGKQITITYYPITEFTQASGALSLAGYSMTNCYPIEIADGGVSLGSGHATVTVPYEMKDGSKSAKVYFVDAMGAKSDVTSSYDATACSVSFTVEHFSTYVITEEEGTIVVPTDETTSGNKPTGDTISTGAIIAIVIVVVVILATGGTFAYIMLSAKTKKKTRKNRFNF